MHCTCFRAAHPEIPISESCGVSTAEMLFPCKIFLCSLYCSAAVEKQVTCANSERLLIKEKRWHLLLAVLLKGMCLKARERYHEPQEVSEISVENVEKSLSIEQGRFPIMLGKKEQLKDKKTSECSQRGQEWVGSKLTLIFHVSHPWAGLVLLCELWSSGK